MKAMVIVPGDKGGTLGLRDVPEPKPQAGQVLIRVKATALNRADLYQRQGRYPLQDALAAQEYLAANAHIGKIVLTV